MNSSGFVGQAWRVPYAPRFYKNQYVRLRDKASGQEVVYLGGLTAPFPTAKPIGKGGGASPPPLFQRVLREEGAVWTPKTIDFRTGSSTV